MILVIGGISSGCRSYVRSLGFADGEFSGSVDDARPVLVEAQTLACANDADIASLACAIAENKQVVICREVGSGIVPATREEREWRDRAGALAKDLASRADAVVRMTCGIPQMLKGARPLDEVEVVIMRHGTTEANERHEYAGSSDVALSDKGRAEAEAAGVLPYVDKVHVSPLARARETAAICFPRAHQVVVDGFREMDFGDFEGRSAKDMEDDAAYREWVEGLCEGRCPNGECKADLISRVTRAFEEVVRAALRAGEKRVVVVAHGGTIMSALDSLSQDGRGYFEWRVGGCEGYCCKARFHAGSLVLEHPQRFGDLGFMRGEHPQPGSSFFANRACKYFPCHEGIDERDFNCLFCYCPLYALGPDCGGNFTYNDKGRKNCTGCTLPHRGDAGAKLVAARYEQIAALAAR